MKKTVLLIATAFVIGLTGCKKDDEVTSVTLPEETLSLGTITIKGFLKADYDITNSGIEVVSGEKIFVTIDTKDWYLNPIPGKTYPKKRYEATTNTDGQFDIKIDAPNNGVLKNVTVTAVEFTKNRIENTNPPTNPPSTISKPYKWSTANENYGTLEVGEVKLKIFTMTGTPFS